MSVPRSVIALDPRRFGRGRLYHFPADERTVAPWVLNDDIRLFVTTFVGGFLFVAVYLA